MAAQQVWEQSLYFVKIAWRFHSLKGVSKIQVRQKALQSSTCQTQKKSSHEKGEDKVSQI